MDNQRNHLKQRFFQRIHAWVHPHEGDQLEIIQTQFPHIQDHDFQTHPNQKSPPPNLHQLVVLEGRDANAKALR